MDALVRLVQRLLVGGPAEPSREPWLAWLVVALCRQRARQDFLAYVVAEHLDDNDDDEGEVPGLPGWSFRFHGSGLLLVGPGHEQLDVDFFPGDDEPRTIDPHFFLTRLLALDPVPPVEGAVRGWLGEGKQLALAALDELRERGVIGHPSSQHVFHLHPWLEAHYAEVAAVDLDNPAVAARWRRGLGGRSEPDSAAFLAWGLGLLGDRRRARAIDELAPMLPREAAEEACWGLTDGPIDSVTGRALGALRRLGVVPGQRAKALAARIDPSQHNPFSACELAEWWMERGQVAEGMALVQRCSAQRVIVGFRGNPHDYRYAFLALRYAPDAAMPLVRQALRSSTPDSRERMAGLLAVWDAPWCRAELLAAAEEGPSDEVLRMLVACLMHGDDEATRARAARLLPPPPSFEEGRVGYSREEVLFLNLRGIVAWRLAAANKDLARLLPDG